MKVNEEIKYFEKKFPERLQMLLERYDMTQKELADKIGINEVTMSRYANGLRIPKAPVICSMSKVLLCSVEFLLCYVEEFPEEEEVKE